MKKIFSIFALTALFLTSCSEVEEPNLGLNNSWLQYDKAAYVTSEASPETVKIPVFLSGSSNSNGVDVNFTVTTTASSSDYTISPANGVLNIPAGKFVGYIEVTPINNTTIADDIVLNFSFAENTVPVGLAGQGRENMTTKLTIIEDDCPYDINEFVGTYSALQEGNVDDSENQLYYDVVATLGTDPGTLILANLWDVKGTSTATLDFSNPASPRITFTSGEFLFVHPTYGTTFVVDPKDLTPPDLSTPSTFKTCSKEMDLYFFVFLPDGRTFGKQHITLTKK